MTNNNDLTTTVVAPGGITLPDVLTESDLFTNLDTSLLFPQNLNLEPAGKQPGNMDFGSQLLPDSSFRRSMSHEPARLEDPSLVDLDLGEDEMPLGLDSTMEIGRDAPPPRPMEDDLYSDAGKLNDNDDLGLDLGEDDVPLDKMDLDDGLDNDMLPDIDNTVGALGIKPPHKRQLPSLPFIDSDALPDLGAATGSLGIDEEKKKRQIPDLPFVDEGVLPDLGETEETLLPGNERRDIIPHVPGVDYHELPSVDRTVGAFGIASADRERRRRQLRDTDLPVVDESMLPDITSASKSLGLWEDKRKRQLPDTGKSFFS